MDFVEDRQKIEALYRLYERSISKLHVSPLTGAKGKKIASIAAKAQALNIHLYNPQIVFLWSEVLTFAHLNVWLEYINASKVRFAICAPSRKGRTPESVGLRDVPVYAWDESFDAKGFLPLAPALNAIFYTVNKAANNTFISHFLRHLHVHIHHGDSDKSGSFSRLDAMYDYLIVADANAADRFRRAGVHIAQDHFLAVGGTVIPGVTSSAETGRFKNVLYAPTFEGWSASANFSSLLRSGDRIDEHILAYPEDVVVRGHHSAGARQATYKERARKLAGATEAKQMTKVEQFNWSDVIVADVSGIISEYLFTGKPLITPVAKGDEWILAHMKANGLLKYVYPWDYKEMSLKDFLVSIKSDSLKAAREKRRRALYFGARSFEDSRRFFEDAIQLIILRDKTRRLLEKTTPKYEPIDLPTDESLASIVRDIQSGRVMLRATPASGIKPVATAVLDGPHGVPGPQAD